MTIAKRVFPTGASRNEDSYKDDYEGYFSPVAIEAFGQFMTKNRYTEDGTFRESDNWQKGIPDTSYMKSLWRHMLSVWKWHRKYPTKETPEDALCAIIFNAMGMLHNMKTKVKASPCQLHDICSTDPEMPFWVRKDQMDPISFPLNKSELEGMDGPRLDPIDGKIGDAY